MSIRFKYKNECDTGTVFSYSNQITTLPASNVQNEIKSKIWKTEDGFIVHSGIINLPFRDTSTGSVKNYPIPSGTYTGSGLASVIESGLNSAGDYTDHSATFDSTDNKFTISRSSGASVFRLVFNDSTYRDKAVAYLLGFERVTDYTGTYGYSGTATLGNEHELIIEFTSTGSIMTVIVDNHNLTSGAVMRARLAESATAFDGGWNLTSTILRTSTLTFNSGVITIDFTSTVAKAVQLYLADRSVVYLSVGRVWASEYEEMAYKTYTEEEITWDRKKWINRTRSKLSQAGAAWFDLKEKLEEYSIPIDPLDKYYNTATVDLIDNLLERVETNQSFYIEFEPSSPESTTVYGYLVGHFTWDRLRKTPVKKINKLIFREQK